eukprot:scaffold133_cov257-Pinguiococcus_pyrenoidosus.AAC.4
MVKCGSHSSCDSSTVRLPPAWKNKVNVKVHPRRLRPDVVDAVVEWPSGSTLVVSKSRRGRAASGGAAAGSLGRCGRTSRRPLSCWSSRPEWHGRANPRSATHRRSTARWQRRLVGRQAPWTLRRPRSTQPRGCLTAPGTPLHTRRNHLSGHCAAADPAATLPYIQWLLRPAGDGPAVPTRQGQDGTMLHIRGLLRSRRLPMPAARSHLA